MEAAPAAVASRDSGSAVRNETRGTVLAHRLEIAASLWGKFVGLMGRRTLPPGHGLFLPDSNGIHMMFMRFPIDAVFVGRRATGGERRVLSVHRRVRPWIGIVPFVRGAAGVLELPTGAIDASGTLPGDIVRLGTDD